MYVRSANGVSRSLRARGINVGYRHTDLGYIDRNGQKITEPGVQITRNKPHRYSGYEDYGFVAIFVITPDGREDPVYSERVQEALRDAKLPFEQGAMDFFKVLDTHDVPKAEPEEQQRYSVQLVERVYYNITVEADSEEDARAKALQGHDVGESREYDGPVVEIIDLSRAERSKK